MPVMPSVAVMMSTPSHLPQVVPKLVTNLLNEPSVVARVQAMSPLQPVAVFQLLEPLGKL